MTVALTVICCNPTMAVFTSIFAIGNAAPASHVYKINCTALINNIENNAHKTPSHYHRISDRKVENLAKLFLP